MHKNLNQKIGSVLLFRFVSGEEVIAKLTAITDEGVSIGDPRVMVPLGNQEIGIMPWVPYCVTDEMVIPTDKVMFAVPPKRQLLSDYQSSVTGIVVPEGGAQMGNKLRLVDS